MKVLGGFPRSWSRSVLLSTCDIFAQRQPSLTLSELRHYSASQTKTQPRCSVPFLCQILTLSSSHHLFFRISKAVLYLEPSFSGRPTGYCLGTFKTVKYFFSLLLVIGDRDSTVVKVLCYKSEGRWFNPSWCQWIFH